MDYRGHLFVDGGNSSRMRLCTEQTSIVTFCFRKIGSGHFIAINLTRLLSVNSGRSRICAVAWILSSMTAYHSVEASFSFLDGSLEQLRPGGVYIVEDIRQDMVDEWYDRLETIHSKRYSNCEFALALLPNPTHSDLNNLLVIRRVR